MISTPGPCLKTLCSAPVSDTSTSARRATGHVGLASEGGGVNRAPKVWGGGVNRAPKVWGGGVNRAPKVWGGVNRAPKLWGGGQ